MENKIISKGNKIKQHHLFPFFVNVLRGEKLLPGCLLFNLEGHYALIQEIHVFLRK